jgi:RNA polymerase sporulation-specific sigma factor
MDNDFKETGNKKINPKDHLGLVHSCAKKFKGRGIEYDDLYQAGCVGLIKAVNGFDYTRGLQFSTYAVTVILGEIRHLFREGGSIKVSRRLKELSLKIERERDRFIKLKGREPTLSELSQILNESEDDITEAIASSKSVTSIDAEDDDFPKPHIATTQSEENLIDKISVKEAIDKLPPKDRELIILRYFNDKTQNDTAKVLGISQVQVSRREKIILMKMKELLSA